MDKEPAYDYEEDREKEENDKKWGEKTVREETGQTIWPIFHAFARCINPIF